MSKANDAAVWIAGGSLFVSVISLSITWRSRRRLRVRFETLEADRQPWLTVIIRNPGGVPAQITGWGVRAGDHFIGRYSGLRSGTAGSPDLGAPSSLPYELPAAAYIRLSWESTEVYEEYKRRYSSAPKWLRVYVEVGWKRTCIKSHLPRRWPQ